jgi:hypothetical protein
MWYVRQYDERKRPNERREQYGQRIPDLHPILRRPPRMYVGFCSFPSAFVPDFVPLKVVRFVGSTAYMIIRLFAGE